MIFRQSILSTKCGTSVQKRVFDLLIDGNTVVIEVKHGRTTVEISMEELLFQVDEITKHL